MNTMNSHSGQPVPGDQGPFEAPGGGVVVRMYRQGRGDCFLLAVSPEDESGSEIKTKTKYILIDCGVHSRQNSGPDRLTQVMDNIHSETGGHLDIVVATHEHADHMSGFIHKNSPFLAGKFSIGELWLGWTEKRGDKQADRLRTKRGTARSVIEKTLENIRPDQSGLPTDQAADRETLTRRIRHYKDFELFPEGTDDEISIAKRIHELCDCGSDPEGARANVEVVFQAFARTSDSDALAASEGPSKKPSKNELALALLASLAETVVYAEPGSVLEVPGVGHLRAHVLAPPRDEKLLKKDQPSKIRKSEREKLPDDHSEGLYKEVYLSNDPGDRAFMYAPALGEDLPFKVAEDFPKHEMRFPFNRSHFFVRADDERIKEGPPFKSSEDIEALFKATYHQAGAEWRQIEDDWLAKSENLALNLDSDTNNTSLVLAFEWGEPGKGQVFLFAGDAQVGNWLSWRRQDYKAGDETQTADELLDRTVLYKVGHHASHNATGRRDSSEVTTKHPLGVPFGLELMDDIIAMIPIDRTAAQKNRPWEMPYGPLYRRLREKARRRVLRSDLSLEPLKETEDQPDITPGSDWSNTPGLKNVRWRAAGDKFTRAPKQPLYYDVEFKPK